MSTKKVLALRLMLVKSCTVYRFRTGAAKLPKHDHTHARQDRQCLCCQSGALSDAQHLLLRRPALQPVRHWIALCFTEADPMQMLLWQESLSLVACCPELIAYRSSMVLTTKYKPLIELAGVG